MTKKKKSVLGTSFQSFLEEEGIFEEVNIQAIKQTIALQLLDAMEELSITQTEMAERLGTSRAALKRLLDPNNTSVTLHTLARAAAAVGKKLHIALA